MHIAQPIFNPSIGLCPNMYYIFKCAIYSCFMRLFVVHYSNSFRSAPHTRTKTRWKKNHFISFQCIFSTSLSVWLKINVILCLDWKRRYCFRFQILFVIRLWLLFEDCFFILFYFLLYRALLYSCIAFLILSCFSLPPLLPLFLSCLFDLAWTMSLLLAPSSIPPIWEDTLFNGLYMEHFEWLCVNLIRSCDWHPIKCLCISSIHR